MNAITISLQGIILLPVGLVAMGFALGVIGARFRWPGWRTLAGLIWLGAAITAETLLIQAIFVVIDYHRVGLFLIGSLALILFSLIVFFIERTIARRIDRHHQGTPPIAPQAVAATPASRAARMPVASLGVVVGLLVGISSILLPVITEPVASQVAGAAPTTIPILSPIPSITPVMPPTNTPYPTIPPTATALPTLTITPTETLIPTLIQPPTETPIPSITLTPSTTSPIPTLTRTARPPRPLPTDLAGN